MSFRVLVPFDFSPESDRALAWAADLQRAGCVETLDVIHILDPFPTAVMAAALPMPVWTDEDLAALRAELCSAVAAHHVTAAAEVVLDQTAGDAIVARAHKTGATLIVMGTHGRGGLRRLALGSVAEYVVRHAECAVVTLRALDAKAAHAAA